MNDVTDHDKMEEQEENFADLIDSYSPGLNQNIRVGDKINGKIISIGQESAFVDTGSKVDGVVDILELLDEDGNPLFKRGDNVQLYVTAIDESEIRLSRAIAGDGGIYLLREAYEGGVPVEGKVKEQIKGGFHVEVLKRRAFCPLSQMDLKFVQNPEDYVGMGLQFRIVRLEENGRNIVLSRRKLLEEELKESQSGFFENLGVGKVINGKVSKLMPYGAFVELFPGVEGMAHISELSWSRIDKPEVVLKEGQEVRIKVIGFERDEKTGRHKISLSIKQVDDDPWTGVKDRFKPGDKVTGKVTRCMKFGAFVEISPGIEGLVHLSELSYAKRITDTRDAVEPGETVSVMVKEVDETARRISLSLKDAAGEPWMDVTEKYKIGAPVKGTIEKKEGFGLFINLEPGITGLMPKSKIATSDDAKVIEKLRIGDTLTVRVESIDVKNRRLTLAAGDGAEAADWKEFAPDKQNQLGSLGEKLEAALKSRP
jgi:small subunit ribosomal protein S1